MQTLRTRAPSRQELLQHYACGAVQFSGDDNAPYERHLVLDHVVEPQVASLRERFEAVARSLRDLLVPRWLKTDATYARTNPKHVCYLSMEFLSVRSLTNNLTNLQVEPIVRDVLQREGLDLTAVQWFEDVERGQSLRRPAFTRFQRAIGAGAITTVVVWKRGRLARRQHDGINLLTAWCRHNVRVVAETQQIDLRGPVGRMVASVLCELAEIAWEYRRERQAAGIAVAKAQGVSHGRQKGTTKAQPQRAETLCQRGLMVTELPWR